jgi:hypothetical protein
MVKVGDGQASRRATACITALAPPPPAWQLQRSSYTIGKNRTYVNGVNFAASPYDIQTLCDKNWLTFVGNDGDLDNFL